MNCVLSVGVNHGVWSHLKASLFLAVKVSFRIALEEIINKSRLSQFKAGVNTNLSEILGSLKRD